MKTASQNKKRGILEFMIIIIIIVVLVFILYSFFNAFYFIVEDKKDHEFEELKPEWVEELTYDYTNSLFIYEDEIYVLGDVLVSGDGYYASIRKYDMNGNMLMKSKVTDVNLEQFDGKIFIQEDYIYLVGTVFTERPRGGNSGYQDVLVAKYDLNGNMIWNRTWRESYREYGQDIYLDSNHIYVTGETKEDAHITTHGDAFLLKYDLDGNQIWNKTMYAHGGATSLAVLDGYIYVTGTDTSQGVALWKIDSNGDLIWTEEWGNDDNADPYSLFAGNGYIYIVGETWEDHDVFLLKYDTAGNLKWSQTWGRSNYFDIPHSVSVNEGHIFVGGETMVSPGTGEVNNYDAFLLKYDLNGNLIRKKNWDTGEDESVNAMFIENGDIFLTGRVDHGGPGFLMKVSY
jgi:hypothetical protein